MSELAEKILNEAPPAKPKHRRARPRKSKPAATPKPKPAPVARIALAGLSATGCADACNKDGCVISGRNYCAHPLKGGLQHIDLQDRAAIDRLAAAKQHLGRRA